MSFSSDEPKISARRSLPEPASAIARTTSAPGPICAKTVQRPSRSGEGRVTITTETSSVPRHSEIAPATCSPGSRSSSGAVTFAVKRIVESVTVASALRNAAASFANCRLVGL